MVKLIDKIMEQNKVVEGIDDVCEYVSVTRFSSGRMGFTCSGAPNLIQTSVNDYYCTEEDWKYCPFNPVSKK